jgi:hypothetical protein
VVLFESVQNFFLFSFPQYCHCVLV